MKYGHNPRPIRCTMLKILLIAIFTLKRGKLNHKILPYAFLLLVGCVDGVQFVCLRMVAIFHTETFVTFHFDLSLISRLINDSDLNRIK